MFKTRLGTTLGVFWYSANEILSFIVKTSLGLLAAHLHGLNFATPGANLKVTRGLAIRTHFYAADDAAVVK